MTAPPSMNPFRCLFGRNELVEAIMLRNWPEVQLLLANRPAKARTLYRVTSKNGPTVVLPLHHCLMHEAPRHVVRDLIAAYRDGLFLCDSLHKRCPLHIACEGPASPHKLRVIKIILEEEPDVAMVKDKAGCLPLHHAISSKSKLEVIEALLESSNMAASQMDKKGNYPLHLACAQELPCAIVQQLAEAWPDGVLKKVDGKTPSDIVYAGNAPDKKATLQLLRQESAELQFAPASPRNSMMISVANCCGRIVL